MRVRDSMTTELFTIRFDKKLLIVEEIMRWHRIRHVPVVDDGHHLVGLITHRDVLRASISSVETAISKMEAGQHQWTVPIKRVMHTNVVTICPDESIQEAARVMRTAKVGCLPVLEGEKLVGILTEADLLRIVEELPLVAV